jgi:hypothetical protein
MSTSKQAPPLLQSLQREARPKSALRRGAWILLCVLATSVGLASLRYLLPHIPFPIPSSNFAVRRPWLVTHAAFASIALLVGPWQLLTGLQNSRQRWHRRIGWVYMVAGLVGWVSSIPIAMHASAGPVAQAGFLALGAAWITMTSLGLLAAIDRRFDKHRRWMTRSYAVTAAAITLRILLPICLISGAPFKDAYPAIAWACWLTNLCIAEYLLRHSPYATPTAAPSRLKRRPVVEPRHNG